MIKAKGLVLVQLHIDRWCCLPDEEEKIRQWFQALLGEDVEVVSTPATPKRIGEARRTA